MCLSCLFVLPPQAAFVCFSVVMCVLCELLEERHAECASLLQNMDSTTLVVFCKVALWIISYIHQRFVEYHHTAAKCRGYLRLYRQTRATVSVPLLIQSVGELWTRMDTLKETLHMTQTEHLQPQADCITFCLSLQASCLIVLYNVRKLLCEFWLCSCQFSLWSLEGAILLHMYHSCKVINVGFTSLTSSNYLGTQFIEN